MDALMPPSDLQLTEARRGLLLKSPSESLDGFCRHGLSHQSHLPARRALAKARVSASVSNPGGRSR